MSACDCAWYGNRRNSFMDWRQLRRPCTACNRYLLTLHGDETLCPPCRKESTP